MHRPGRQWTRPERICSSAAAMRLRVVVPLALAVMAAASALAVPVRAEPVDLELILAVDSSSSVDYREFGLQMNGLAAAFRNDGVIAAIRDGRLGVIAVSLVQWATPGAERVAIPWALVRGRASAEAFAEAIDNAPRHVPTGGTGISAMLASAAKLFADNGFEGARRVIDVSGDGRDSHGPGLDLTRVAAVAQGITINGLPILSDFPDLEAYFAAQVIGGPGAFTQPAASYDDFAGAIRAKLMREIRGPPIVGQAPSDRKKGSGPFLFLLTSWKD